MKIQKIISGGQTGVDRAALNTAFLLGIPCGGWCPKGRRAEDGVISNSYPLTETGSPVYAVRTKKNVEDADATLVLTWGAPEGGTALTVAYARQAQKAHCVVNLAEHPSAAPVAEWLTAEGVRTLNVAGPRASTCPEVSRHTSRFLETLLSDQAMAVL